MQNTFIKDIRIYIFSSSLFSFPSYSSALPTWVSPNLYSASDSGSWKLCYFLFFFSLQLQCGIDLQIEPLEKSDEGSILPRHVSSSWRNIYGTNKAVDCHTEPLLITESFAILLLENYPLFLSFLKVAMYWNFTLLTVFINFFILFKN